MQQLVKQQGDMQQRLLGLQVEMQLQQGPTFELVSGAVLVRANYTAIYMYTVW